jgi:ribonucleoside-triphosphate reductase
MRDEAVVIGNDAKDATYGEFQIEMDILNRAFAEVMLEGDARGRIFTFPIPTYSITHDFSPEIQPGTYWEMTANMAFIFWQLCEHGNATGDARSMCCRLRQEVREIKRGGGVVWFQPSDRSIGVLPQYATPGLLRKRERIYLPPAARWPSQESLESNGALDRRRRRAFPNSVYYLKSIKQRFKNMGQSFSTVGLIE